MPRYSRKQRQVSTVCYALVASSRSHCRFPADLMECQLLYLLDYDLRIEESELLEHFGLFLNFRPAVSAMGPGRLRERRTPSLESVGSSSSGSDSSSSPLPLTPSSETGPAYPTMAPTSRQYAYGKGVATPEASPPSRRTRIGKYFAGRIDRSRSIDAAMHADGVTIMQ